jgi:hypothetical protein
MFRIAIGALAGATTSVMYIAPHPYWEWAMFVNVVLVSLCRGMN